MLEMLTHLKNIVQIEALPVGTKAGAKRVQSASLTAGKKVKFLFGQLHCLKRGPP